MKLPYPYDNYHAFYFSIPYTNSIIYSYIQTIQSEKHVIIVQNGNYII